MQVVMVKGPNQKWPTIYGPWDWDEWQSPQEWIDENYDEEDKRNLEIEITNLMPR
jgi:hypothetical protein